MPDIRQITILPPQPVQGVAQPQVAGSDAKSLGIINIPVGSVLSGFIINRDNVGNPILRTDSGDITFASNFFLKIGSEITIRIEHTAGQNTAHILSVNGEPPEVAATRSSFAGEPEVKISVGSSGNIENVTHETNKTAIITATVITPASNKAGEAILPTTSNLSLKVISAQTPQIQTTAQPSPPQPQTQSQPTITTAPQTTQQPITNNQQLPISTPFVAYEKVASATPYYSETPQLAPVANPQVSGQTPQATPTQPPQIGERVTANIIRIDQNGSAIVQTPVGVLLLPETVKLPVGSVITFEIAKITTPEVTNQVKTQETGQPNNPIVQAPLNPINAPINTQPTPIAQLARSSGALADIFVLLSGLTSGDALDFVKNTIPNTNTPNYASNPNQTTKQQNIPSALLNFVVALKNGDFREWLGRGNARWLENNGHGALLTKAEGEFATLAQQWTNPPLSQQWQSLFFPIAVDGVLQQTRLFVKRDKKHETVDGVRKEEEDTRFVLEMDLSSLGQMQMDGFVKRGDGRVNFDLVIRSHAPLSKEIQNDILEIYNNTGAITGYKGSLNFQTTNDFPVNPMEDILAEKHQGIVA